MIREAVLEDAQKLAPLMETLGYPTHYEDMYERLRKIQSKEEYKTIVWEKDGEIWGMD